MPNELAGMTFTVKNDREDQRIDIMPNGNGTVVSVESFCIDPQQLFELGILFATIALTQNPKVDRSSAGELLDGYGLTVPAGFETLTSD